MRTTGSDGEKDSDERVETRQNETDARSSNFSDENEHDSSDSCEANTIPICPDRQSHVTQRKTTGLLFRFPSSFLSSIA